MLAGIGYKEVELYGPYPFSTQSASQKVHFSGDGGDPKQWIELFPYMTSAGSGVLDLKLILEVFNVHSHMYRLNQSSIRR